jgi:hypothetical protein
LIVRRSGFTVLQFPSAGLPAFWRVAPCALQCPSASSKYRRRLGVVDLGGVESRVSLAFVEDVVPGIT